MKTTSFISVLNDIRAGKLTKRLTDELAKVCEGVVEQGKGGTLTLKLNIKPNGDDAVTIAPTVTSTVPQPQVGDSVFFTGEEGLTRTSQTQMDIEDELASRRAAGDE